MKSSEKISVVLIALGVALLVSVAQAASLSKESTAPDPPALAQPAQAEGQPAPAAAMSPAISQCGAACCNQQGGACCASQICSSTWFYGDFLCLRPRNAGVEYAVPINGQIQGGTVPVEIGGTGVVDPDFSAGFRVGFDTSLGGCGSLFAEFLDYRNTASDAIATTAPFVLRAMTVNPSTLNAASDSLNASASEATTLDLVDVGYHRCLWACNQNTIGVFAGVRYGHLDQQFHAEYANTILETVDSGVTIDCVGPRVGLDGNWCLGGGFFLHGKAAASFVGGEFRADYTDQAVAAPATPLATTTWHEARFTSILDGELAVGWQNCSGRIRVMAGYLINDWCNVVKPSDFIAGVQANSYRAANQLGQTALIFDGLMVHAEVNF